MPAQLVGWVDMAGDGSFDQPEDRSSPALAAADPAMASGWADATDSTFTTGNIPDGYVGAVTLQWTVSGPPAASTWARLRLATDSSFFSDASPQPAGLKGPGESEGHPVNDSPLAVSLGYFLATRDGDQVDFTWQTATELGTAGFYLLAEVDGDRVQLNNELVPSTVIDSVEPVNYSARYASDATRFHLEEIDVGGARSLHGPFILGEPVGVAVGGIEGEVEMQSIYLPLMSR